MGGAPALAAPGCTVVSSLEQAWRAAGDAGEVCVIGGTSLFEEALPLADVIHLTEVEANVEGDAYFPAFNRQAWETREIARHPADERNDYPIRILELTRRRADAR